MTIQIEDKNNTLKSGDYSSSFNKVVFEEISEGSTCLDVGCWIGNMGAHLIKEKKCTVDGVDFKKDVLEKAKSRGYRKTFQINFNNDEVDFDQIDEKYDFIIFADVLEHLTNPQNVLEHLKNKLKTNGKIVISLPNVAFLQNRINLLRGKWDYKDFGTLDKTHLRFFTIKTGEKLAEDAGLKIAKTKPYNQFGILNHIKPLDSYMPGLLCYQFLIVAENE